MIIGATIGNLNGTNVAFDAGYWDGLATGILRLIDTGKLTLPQSKLNLLQRHANAVTAISVNMDLDPTKESLTDNMRNIKDKGSRLNATISTCTSVSSAASSESPKPVNIRHADW